MNPMRRRRIILATDLSARCDRAFERAVLLAREWDAQLTVAHALEERGGFSPQWRRTNRPKLDAESQIAADLQRARISADVVVRRGSASELIVELARKMSCDLIVTGIARDLGLARAVLGSTLEALARESIAPVLIVKRPARDSYHSAAVGTNFSKGSRAAIQATLQLFPQAKIAALHAYRLPVEGLGGVQITDEAGSRRVLDECTRFVADAAPAAWQDIRCLAALGFPETLLKQYALDWKVDLIVVGSEARNPMAALLLGSTSRSLMLSSPRDLLLVPVDWTSSTGDARGVSHRPEWGVARASQTGPHEDSFAADAHDWKPARP
jgi:nucleotide-binding universal stress UspA family protein